MPDKLYEKDQYPQARFWADWIWRILALIGVAFLSYAQLWGDGRYITREEFPHELSNLVKSVMEKIEPRLSSLERHAVDETKHPTSATTETKYVTRREYEKDIKWLRDWAERIEAKL